MLHIYYIRFVKTENFITEEVLVDVHLDDAMYVDQDFVISEQQIKSNEAESEKENDNDKRKYGLHFFILWKYVLHLTSKK